MKSTHQRNVAAMQAVPKCQALTKAGSPCQKPAMKGTPLCRSHAFEPPPRPARTVRAADQRRAYIELQRDVMREVREIEKLIRWASLNEAHPHLIDSLSERRTRLAELAELNREKPSTAAVPRKVPPPAPALAGTAPAAAKVAVAPSPAKSNAALAAERTRDKAIGAMLGHAVGEAIGVTTAGFERSTRERSGMYGGGKLGLKPGEWAWDTAAMLTIADSLLEQPSFDEQDFIERLIDHRDHGSYSPTGVAVGLGGMTAVALNNFAQSGEMPVPDLSATKPSNGCLARMAPVAVRYWKQPDTMLKIAERQCKVTHAGPGLEQLSEKFIDLLRKAIADYPKFDLLSGCFFDKRRGQTLTYGQLREVPKSQIISGHDAEDAFNAALWCVATGDGFEGAVLRASNLAGDATSIGAMAGQIAGAIYGARAIPPHFLEQLAGRDRIEDTALRLFDAGMAED